MSNRSQTLTMGLSLIVLTFLAASPESFGADAQERAEAACATHRAQNNKQCNVERCPCGRGETRIGKFDRSGLKIALCACSNGSDLELPAAVAQQCNSDADCDDKRFCNGPERCDPDSAAADKRGCVSSRSPCNGLVCFEDTNSCPVECVDADGDGVTAVHCGGADCDDTDANRYPGNTEICDDQGRDEDCDPMTFGQLDDDGDGFISSLCL